MCRKPDSLVTFYLLYFYIYGVLFSFFFNLLFSKRRQHLRCNLLFGLIGHFGLLQDVNISFILSSVHKLSSPYCVFYYFWLFTKDEFIQCPGYMDIHLSNGLRRTTGQILTSLHYIEIEIEIFRIMPPKKNV